MEYIDGPTLTDEKSRQPDRCFDPPAILPWVLQLCDVLAYVHEEVKIVHRDLKPRNLMLDAAGRLKVTDFGIAATISDSHSRLTQVGSSGTPAYMSPQQVSGRRPSAADDIYAAGATLYELLTSKPPFFRGNMVSILHQLSTELPAPMNERRVELGIEGRAPIPSEWEETIAACLAKDPSQRPASMREVAERICAVKQAVIHTRSPPEVEAETLEELSVTAYSTVVDEAEPSAESEPPDFNTADVVEIAPTPEPPPANEPADPLQPPDSTGEGAGGREETPACAVRMPPPPPVGSPRTSRMAATCLVIEIFSFMAPLPGVLVSFMSVLSGVILGHMARSAIRRSQGRLRGRRLALVGLILGYFGTFFFGLILAVNSVKDGVFERMRTDSAKQIYHDCTAYESDHGGKLPLSLNDLVPNYIKPEDAKTLFSDPGHSELWENAWLYYGDGLSLDRVENPAAQVLLASKIEYRGRRVVVHFDGSATIEQFSPPMRNPSPAPSVEKVAPRTGSGSPAPAQTPPQAGSSATPLAGSTPTLSDPARLKGATKDDPFVNSLGMEFVPIPGTKILMCRTLTRVRDFRVYAAATSYPQTEGMSWEQPGFSQSDDHPVVYVSWATAKAFCEWLSKKEGRMYRLPTDAEWSAAVGPGKYPWGDAWPPPQGVGNYAGEESKAGRSENWHSINGYNDGYPRTAPVDKFAQGRYGLFDMGGNVGQLCEDEYRASMNEPDVLTDCPSLTDERYSDGTALRVVRGASWGESREVALRSSYRGRENPTRRGQYYGFRCVLALPGT